MDCLDPAEPPVVELDDEPVPLEVIPVVGVLETVAGELAVDELYVDAPYLPLPYVTAQTGAAGTSNPMATNVSSSLFCRDQVFIVFIFDSIEK